MTVTKASLHPQHLLGGPRCFHQWIKRRERELQLRDHSLGGCFSPEARDKAQSLEYTPHQRRMSHSAHLVDFLWHRSCFESMSLKTQSPEQQISWADLLLAQRSVKYESFFLKETCTKANLVFRGLMLDLCSQGFKDMVHVLLYLPFHPLLALDGHLATDRPDHRCSRIYSQVLPRNSRHSRPLCLARLAWAPQCSLVTRMSECLGH